uniref:Pumilio-family RNA binding repeat domain containing protein n=1 Tax=Babesia bovis TaxID=5865 RepID=A7AMU5_BABBO|eukprot:XP_001611447.1 pumilio-family RNA binding repeat domain containing protein [Babesia bovis T2Bo]
MLSITEVDDYLRGLRDRIAAVQEESSASDKLLLTTNVFEQIQDHISSLAIHQVLSKYLEKLITLLAHSLIEDPVNDIVEKRDLCISLCNQLLLKGDVEVLSKDVFGSHVLQSTLQCCTLFEHQGASISEPLRYFATTVEDRCLFELLHHTSGSHVLRSLMKALVGVLDAEAFQKAKLWKTSILPNAKEIAENSFGNYVLQAVTRNKYFQPTHLEELLETIDMGNLLLTSSSSVVWRICEAAVSLGTGQSQFIKKLQDALHISQYKTKQLKKAKQRETELPPRTDVAPEQYDATENKSDDDDPSVKHNDSEKVKGHIWLALISCQPPEPNRIHLRATGASILLNLLKFDRKLLTNILGDFKHFIRIAKAQQKLLSLATDRHFSRVLQLMLDRRQGLLKEKGIERLFNYLKAHFVELALNINGAFVLSSLFNASPLRLRQSLLTELAPESERIKAKSKKLVEIIGLESFCKNKEQWSKKMSKAQSVRTLFKDIIDTNELH